MVEDVPFVHYIVDFALRDIKTAKGDVITVCNIEANAPLSPDRDTDKVYYGWLHVIEDGKPLNFECGCFDFILIKNCCSDVGIFAIAHSIPNDPSFQAVILENDQIVSTACSLPSIGLKADFNFYCYHADQKLRIETIPNSEGYWMMKEKIAARKVDTDAIG